MSLLDGRGDSSSRSASSITGGGGLAFVGVRCKGVFPGLMPKGSVGSGSGISGCVGLGSGGSGPALSDPRDPRLGGLLNALVGDVRSENGGVSYKELTLPAEFDRWGCCTPGMCSGGDGGSSSSTRFCKARPSSTCIFCRTRCAKEFDSGDARKDSRDPVSPSPSVMRKSVSWVLCRDGFWLEPFKASSAFLRGPAFVSTCSWGSGGTPCDTV